MVMTYSSDDLITETTDTATETSTRSTTGLLTTETASTDTEDRGSDSSLPIGAQAGIGAGVGVAGLALIVGGFLWWRRRRRASLPLEGIHDPEPSTITSEQGVSELQPSAVSHGSVTSPRTYQMHAPTPASEIAEWQR